MRTNWVREKILSGQPTIGCFMGLGSPNLAELLAHAGYDWLVIETEHNALDTAQVEHILMAMNGTETVPIVRIPSANPVFIQRALDIGGMGILVPMVRTADEAQAIVDATRYPPQGKRGWGPLRASQYTVDNEDYFNRANDNILVFLLIETKEAVENLEAIGTVPGVDVLYIGMWDLCLSMGLNLLHIPFPETDAVIERALEVGREVSVAIGFGESTPEGLRKRQAQGFTVLGYGPDYYLLLQAARAGLEVFNRS